MKLYSMLLASASALVTANLSAEPHHHHHHDNAGATTLAAHSHGEAFLNMVLEGQLLVIELQSPANNILGFEHAPKNEQQRRAVTQARQALTEATRVVTLDGGNCSQQAYELATPGLDAGDHGGQASSHAEFVVTYRLQCTQPDKLAAAKVQLFEHFQGFEKVRSQWFIDQQGAKTLTADDRSMRFKR